MNVIVDILILIGLYGLIFLFAYILYKRNEKQIKEFTENIIIESKKFPTFLGISIVILTSIAGIFCVYFFLFEVIILWIFLLLIFPFVYFLFIKKKAIQDRCKSI